MCLEAASVRRSTVLCDAYILHDDGFVCSAVLVESGQLCLYSMLNAKGL